MSKTGLKRIKALGMAETERLSCGSFNSVKVAVVAARCPPADPPEAAIRWGLIFHLGGVLAKVSHCRFSIHNAAIGLDAIAAFHAIFGSTYGHLYRQDASLVSRIWLESRCSIRHQRKENSGARSPDCRVGQKYVEIERGLFGCFVSYDLVGFWPNLCAGETLYKEQNENYIFHRLLRCISIWVRLMPCPCRFNNGFKIGVLWIPAQFFMCLCGISDEDGTVAFAPRVVFRLEWGVRLRCGRLRSLLSRYIRLHSLGYMHR